MNIKCPHRVMFVVFERISALISRTDHIKLISGDCTVAVLPNTHTRTNNRRHKPEKNPIYVKKLNEK